MYYYSMSKFLSAFPDKQAFYNLTNFNYHYRKSFHASPVDNYGVEAFLYIVKHIPDGMMVTFRRSVQVNKHGMTDSRDAYLHISLPWTIN